MSDHSISTDRVFQLYQSQSQFPVDFEDAWRWLGYNKKSDAKEALLSKGFVLGLDMRIDPQSDNHEGLSPQEKAVKARKESIWLTVDCFKMWAMMAGTEKGRETRLYFLECERQLKQVASTPKKKMVTLFELSDQELGRLYAYLLSLERGITPDEELIHGISRVYLQATSGAVIYAHKWGVAATARQKKLTEETLQNIGWCKYDRREINRLEKAIVDAEKAISSIENEDFWLRYKSECYDFEGKQSDIAHAAECSSNIQTNQSACQP
jgi:hypothetical protein